MRRVIRFICVVLAFAFVFTFNLKTVNADGKYVYLGGMPAGFSMYTRGAYVVGISDVITENGLKSPAKDSGIKIGDVILSIDNFEINNANDIEIALRTYGDKTLSIKRLGEVNKIILTPAVDMLGKQKLGVFVRDNVSGIGTVSFIDGDRFASLGHPVIDENGEIMEIVKGEMFLCNISGYVKGERGKPGELRGVFVKNKVVAKIDKNLYCGVYGEIINYNCSDLTKIEIGKAKMGDASIFTTIDGDKPKEYSISIIKVEDNDDCKNFVIKINDKRLLNTTGGIIQGMSGSPIVQDGKLVGAVTHVFINDPMRGFGISIDNMINR